MEFLVLFKTISSAMLEIFLLATVGFVMVRRRFIGAEGLEFLSKLVVVFILPLFIFSKITKSFSFSIYTNWWIFPLISIIINAVGFALGYFAMGLFRFAKTTQDKRQFISLVGFQNSGYLPLILMATILSAIDAEQMFIYIFLFLLGFNLLIWSFGVWFLSGRGIKHFELGSVFSPPVVAAIISLLFVALGFNRLIPEFIFRPVKMLGDCVLPLSMIIVGGNLASVSIRNVDKKTIAKVMVLKLILMPILALFVLWYLKPEYLIGLLIILEAAVPSATTLSLISRHYNLEDRFISHGIFFTHLAGIFSIPLFLIIYQMFAFFK